MIQAIFIVLLITLPVMAALRSLLGKRVERVMLRSSPKVKEEPRATIENNEVDALSSLTIKKLNSGSKELQSDENRHAGSAPSRVLFRRMCLYDALTMLIAVAVWYLSHWVQFQHANWLIDELIVYLTVFYLAVVVVRYFVSVKRFKSGTIQGTEKKSWVRRWITIGPELLVSLFTRPRYSWYPLFFIFYVYYEYGRGLDLLDTNRYYAFNLVIVTAVVVYVLLRVHLDRLAQRGTNRSMLILRVFGRDENATLTFGALRGYWQQIGSTFTVVDPSFIRHKYRSNSEQHIAIIFFSALAWVFIFGTPEFNEWWGISVILSVLILIGYALALIGLYIRAPKSFAASPEQTRDRLKQFMRRPRRLDLTFKNFDLYGFANTWKDAVSQFILEADVIVMDLRGFSENNKGCETEIDLLFDTKPINQFVFLVNTDSDLNAVEKTLQERWALLQTNSPNLIESPHPVTIYHSQNEDEADLRCLINLLYSHTGSQTSA